MFDSISSRLDSMRFSQIGKQLANAQRLISSKAAVQTGASNRLPRILYFLITPPGQGESSCRAVHLLRLLGITVLELSHLVNSVVEPLCKGAVRRVEGDLAFSVERV
jgi:hypothetical protein